MIAAVTTDQVVNDNVNSLSEIISRTHMKDKGDTVYDEGCKGYEEDGHRPTICSLGYITHYRTSYGRSYMYLTWHSSPSVFTNLPMYVANNNHSFGQDRYCQLRSYVLDIASMHAVCVGL